MGLLPILLGSSPMARVLSLEKLWEFFFSYNVGFFSKIRKNVSKWQFFLKFADNQLIWKKCSFWEKSSKTTVPIFFYFLTNLEKHTGSHTFLGNMLPVAIATLHNPGTFLFNLFGIRFSSNILVLSVSRGVVVSVVAIHAKGMSSIPSVETWFSKNRNDQIS